MALALIGESLLSAVIEVLVDKLTSPEVLGFFKSHKPNDVLREKLEETQNSVKGLLFDVEEKQITKAGVKIKLDRAEDLLEDIAYEHLRSKDKAAHSPCQDSGKARQCISKRGEFSNSKVPQCDDIFSNPTFQQGDDVFSNARVQQGADFVRNPEVQKLLLECFKQIAKHNHYNDVPSLIFKMSRRPLTITNWEKGDLIGKGSFASLYKGSNLDGLFFAVKEVSLSDEKRLRCLKNEIALLTNLDHENIVHYYGTDKDEENLYLFLELVSHGNLKQAYMSCRFKESQISQYTRLILQGLKYLHDNNVIHRDLKCENILVSECGEIKLADFGLSKLKKDSIPLKPGSRSTFWMAPEVANPRSPGYDSPADIWSLGCTVVEMSTGRYPQYNAKNDWELERAIRKGRGPIIPDYLSKHLKDFLNKCLQPLPDKRPTAAELLAHDPFVNESSSAQPDLNELLFGES